MSTQFDTARPADDPVTALRLATCSDGAPSARNLIVTVFGDVVAPTGDRTEVGVQALAATLEGFGVNERLVRTSLSRLVHDDVLAVRAEGRRSFYRIAPGATSMFAAADERIYRGRPSPWDGCWTLVVLDGAEATAERRAGLRARLSELGLGVVAPNVLGSPVVRAEDVASVVAAEGGFDRVLVTRSHLVTGSGLSDDPELAARCLGLDEQERSYREVADLLEGFDDDLAGGLDGPLAAKLRLLTVATFRRVALTDPMLAPELLPSDWAGARARAAAAQVYRAVSPTADRWLSEVLGVDVATPPDRFGDGQAR